MPAARLVGFAGMSLIVGYDIMFLVMRLEIDYLLTEIVRSIDPVSTALNHPFFSLWLTIRYHALEQSMPSSGPYADVEIQILPMEPAGYPVHIRLNHEQEFAVAHLAPLTWQPEFTATEAGQQLADWFFAAEGLRLAWGRDARTMSAAAPPTAPRRTSAGTPLAPLGAATR